MELDRSLEAAPAAGGISQTASFWRVFLMVAGLTVFGSLSIEVRNVPSENPRTGRLSYLSTIALLRDLGATLRVGT